MSGKLAMMVCDSCGYGDKTTRRKFCPECGKAKLMTRRQVRAMLLRGRAFRAASQALLPLTLRQIDRIKRKYFTP